MKPKRTKETGIRKPSKENWVDVDDLVGPGEVKEIAPCLWVVNNGVVLDPPEPIKRPRKSRPRKKSA